MGEQGAVVLSLEMSGLIRSANSMSYGVRARFGGKQLTIGGGVIVETAVWIQIVLCCLLFKCPSRFGCSSTGSSRLANRESPRFILPGPLAHEHADRRGARRR